MNRELDCWQKRMPTLEEYDREVERRLWRRRLKALGEIAGGIAFFALLAATAWLCCVASGYNWE